MPDMRFAPPPSLRIHPQTGGLNSMSVRGTNERLILSLLVQNGAMSRLDLGKKSGLSAQTISVIVRALQRDGLIVSGPAQRGRVGPPTIPVALNPEGAFGIGISLMPHGIETVLTDLSGATTSRMFHRIAAGDDPVAALKSAIEATVTDLPEAIAARMSGIGLALPSDLGVWTDHLGDGDLLERHLGSATALPIYIQNGVSAAASAEGVFGAARDRSDYLFVHVGALTEYRLVLQHQVFAGDPPLAAEAGPGDLSALAGGLVEAGNLDWDGLEPEAFGGWRNQAVAEIASRIKGLGAFVQVSNVLVVGYLPQDLSGRFIEALAQSLPHATVAPAGIARASTAVGAATLALTARFLLQD